MDLDAYLAPILATCRSQFPKRCRKCNKVFPSFDIYVKETGPVGTQPDFSDDDDPLGFLSLVNCSCGTTIALRCETPDIHRAFLETLRREARAAGRSEIEVLTALRDRIRAIAIGSDTAS